MSARILDCTIEEYRADPMPEPSLSSSIAHQLVSKSPLHAWLAHPRLGKKFAPPTDEMSVGSLVHRLLLSAGPEIVCIDAKDFRTNAAKEARDAAIEDGKLPVLQHKLNELVTITDILRARFDELGIKLDGQPEVAVTWEEETTGGAKVVCRGMMDHLVLARGVIYDIKTISSAHPKICTRHMIDYGYAMQRAAYTSAVAKLRPALEGRVDFVFLFCETEAPYSVTPARAAGSMRELGAMQWQRAIDQWSWCLRSNKWPGYADSILELEAPPWAMSSELGEVA